MSAGHLDDLEANEENLAHLNERKILRSHLQTLGEDRALGLWLDLDDGSAVSICGLTTGGIEIDWVTPEDMFDLERQRMEERSAEDF